jgi:hypothetical protein
MNTSEPLCKDLLGLVLDFMDLTPKEMVEMSLIERFARDHLAYRLETQRLLKERNNYYLQALSKPSFTLDKIPEPIRNKEMCLKAIALFHNAELHVFRPHLNPMQYVPNHLKDRELCLRAIRSAILALRHVPEEIRDYEMCMEAMKAKNVFLDKYNADDYDEQYFTSPMMDVGRWLQRNSALRYVPVEHRTRELCILAIKHFYSDDDDFIPEKFWDDEEMLDIICSQEGYDF